MSLTPLDWTIIAAYFLVSAAIGVGMSRRGGRSVTDYFLSGRQLPWWLAGTSMVATTFAADTPLAVAGLVARNGIAGNWIWWSAAFGSVLTVFFFARLWRRAGILTDVEFAELRYSGRPAAILRGFRAVYLGLPINCVIMGWVNLAMAKILSVTLGWDQLTAVLISLGVTGVYSAMSGLWGVVVTDFVQFTFAMIGTTALAWYAVQLPEIGGLSGLVSRLPAGTTDFVPSFTSADATAIVTLPIASFFTYVAVQWWSSWYPGQEPGGGGYIAQRMMSAKDERHSLFATLWFTVAHYCVRPWPWILVGLVAMVLYPTLTDKEAGYAMVIRDHLPEGWRGLLLGAFFAAYMSTISSQLNWGTSYIVNDFYRRFLQRDGTEAHYVWAGRITTLMLMVLSGIVTFYLESIRQAWEFVLESGAGIGLVLILRWYWWRINAWSEIAAMIAAAVGYAGVKMFTTLVFPYSLLAVVAWTTVAWLVVTLATPPESDEHLIAFYRRTRPDGPGWSRIAQRSGAPAPGPLRGLFVNWAAGVVVVYGALFAVGHALLGSASAALACTAAVVAAVGVLLRRTSKVSPPAANV